MDTDLQTPWIKPEPAPITNWCCLFINWKISLSKWRAMLSLNKEAMVSHIWVWIASQVHTVFFYHDVWGYEIELANSRALYAYGGSLTMGMDQCLHQDLHWYSLHSICNNSKIALRGKHVSYLPRTNTTVFHYPNPCQIIHILIYWIYPCWGSVIYHQYLFSNWSTLFAVAISWKINNIDK